MPSPANRKPLIGLTTYRNLNPIGFNQFSLAEAYSEALIKAGACPVLIPLGLPEATIKELPNHLDGFLFTGGGDIHPQAYGDQFDSQVKEVDTDRDRLELSLLQEILRQRLPFFGICRGLQLINVGFGGILYKDILDERPGALKHQCSPDWPRNHLAHPVQMEEESRLGKILGRTELMVNSLHHQGVKELSASLKLTAFAPDGIVEGFELPDYPFGLAVQWHPEWLQEHPSMQALFRSFVEAARDEHTKP